MKQLLVIPPLPGPNEAVSSAALFDALLPEAEGLEWVMWGEPWLVPFAESEKAVRLLEARVRAELRGVRIGWASLRAVLSQAVRVMEGTFIGDKERADVPPWPTTGRDELHGRFEVVVTVAGGSVWWVSADPLVIGRLRAAFPHARLEHGSP